MKGTGWFARFSLGTVLVFSVCPGSQAHATPGSHYVAGKFGTGVCFDGIDDVVEVPDDATLALNHDLTIEAFVKGLAVAEHYAIVTKSHPTATDSAYYFGVRAVDPPPTLAFKYNSPSSPTWNDKLSSGGYPFFDGNWHHVAVTRRGGTIRFYVDGMLDGTSTGNPTADTNSFPVLIGNNALPNAEFNGVIDEVRLSDIARDPSEFCLAGECSVDASTMALWHFNEGSGHAVYDETGNGNDGTISGSGCVEPDSDGDGVPDGDDLCPETVMPEGVPTIRLGVNRWALTDDSGVFSTRAPRGHGKGPRLSFTVKDAAGCSCEQIIAALDLGRGHTKFGCSISAMQDWVDEISK